MFLELVNNSVTRHTKTIKRVPRSGSREASGKPNPEGPACPDDPDGPEAPEVPELTSLCPYSPNPGCTQDDLISFVVLCNSVPPPFSSFCFRAPEISSGRGTWVRTVRAGVRSRTDNHVRRMECPEEGLLRSPPGDSRVPASAVGEDGPPRLSG